MKLSDIPSTRAYTTAPPAWLLKLLLAAALALGWAAPAAAIDITGWLCLPGTMPSASCGSMGANGAVGMPPGAPVTDTYGWVSTQGGVTASLVIPDSIKNFNGGSAVTGATNASRIDSPIFHANAGQELSFWFNYVTSDGGPYPDFAWARLLDTDGHDVAILFTARTMPSGDIVPGSNMPPLAPGLTLTPPSTPIQAPGYNKPAPGPVWAPLGTMSSGLCYDAGCGYTGWVQAKYTFPAAGNYRLEFGVANWVDTAYNSGLAFYGAKIGGVTIEEELKPDLVPTLTGPAVLATGTHDHFTVTVTNQGGASNADGLLTINLPAGATLEASYFPLPAYCTPVLPANDSFTCNLPVIASGDSLPIEFVLTSSTVGTGTITGNVTGVTNESNTLNNDTLLHVEFIVPPGRPDLVPAITGPIDLPAGPTGGTYYVTVTNLGTDYSVDGIVVIALPADVTVDTSLLQSYCSLTAGPPQQITCDLTLAPPILPTPHHIEPGEHLTVVFKLTTAVQNHAGVITVTVSGVTDESDITNNKATHLLTNSRVIPRIPGSNGGGTAIPTLGEMALLLLALTLAGSAAARMRRRGK